MIIPLMQVVAFVLLYSVQFDSLRLRQEIGISQLSKLSFVHKKTQKNLYGAVGWLYKAKNLTANLHSDETHTF